MDPDKGRNLGAEIAFIDHDEFLVARKRTISGDPKPAAFCRQGRGGDTLDRFWPSLQAAIMIARIVIAMLVVHRIFNLNTNYSLNSQYLQDAPVAVYRSPLGSKKKKARPLRSGER